MNLFRAEESTIAENTSTDTVLQLPEKQAAVPDTVSPGVDTVDTAVPDSAVVPATVERPKPAADSPKSPPIQHPVISSLAVEVSPEEGCVLEVDGIRRPVGEAFDSEAGTHDVVVMRAGYPLVERRIRTGTSMTRESIDLAGEFVNTAEIEVRLILNPPDTAALIGMLQMTLNGSTLRFANPHQQTFKRLAGRWRFEVKTLPPNSTVINSCVVYPYGGGQRAVVIGDTGSINLNAGDYPTVPLAVFWSEL